MKIFSFPPIVNKQSSVLILGTMPGAKSLALNQYYGHGGNHFWKILFYLFSEKFTTDYETRKQLLLNHNLALWDVLQACVREGSLDVNIQEETPNDFSTLFIQYPGIELIAFNGKNAEAYFSNYVVLPKKIPMITLPSTSPANTWKTFEMKAKEWGAIIR
jgi:hypoxanthine-DNA glycosylase